MTITDFKSNYLMYENMAIWEVKNMESFFQADEHLKEIFEKEYGFSYSKIDDPAISFTDTLNQTISKLLDYFGDKHFFVFGNNDAHHHDLKELQDKKVINFGMDVHVLNPNSVYVLEMDKTKDLKKYDKI